MTTEAQAIAALADKARTPSAPQIVELKDGRTLLFHEDDLIQIDVSDPAREIEPPPYIKQSVTLQTVDSLVEYVERQKQMHTLLFADIKDSTISAIIDYHGASDGGFSGHADLLFHRAKLSLSYSEEWTTWKGAHKRLMGQLEFARFIEENAADIFSPSGADLLEVTRDLHALRKVNFKKAVRTATENESFEYSDETELKGKNAVEVPTKFLLSLPVYFGEAPTSIYAFLRWKLDDGNLQLGIELHRMEIVRQSVFKQIVANVAEATGRPALFGSV